MLLPSVTPVLGDAAPAAGASSTAALAGLAMAMALVLVTFAVAAAVLVGAGHLVARLLGVRTLTGRSLFAAFWMGFALAIALLQAWHLLAPITWQPTAVLAALGAVGLLWGRAEVPRWIARAVVRHPGVALASAAVWVWLANLATGPGDAVDSGLYHYTVILWTKGYPVVKGLANLSPMFAYNQSSLLWASLLDAWPWPDRANHVSNSTLLAVAFLPSIAALPGMFRTVGVDRAGHAYHAVLLVPLVMLALSKEVCCPKTDLPLALVVYAATFIAWDGWLRTLELPARERGYRLLVVATLCALMVTLKLSGAAYAFALLVLTTVLFAVGTARRRRSGALPGRQWPWLPASALAGLLLFAPWVGSNIVTAGYPLFPSTVLPAPVQWRAKPEIMEIFNSWTVNHTKGRLPLFLSRKVRETPLRPYARLMRPPFEKLDEIEGWEWLRPWFFALPLSSPVEVVIPLGLLLAVAVAWLRRRRRGERRPTGAWFLLPGAAGLVFWFFTAPGPRYAYGVTWVMAAVGIAALSLLRPDERSVPVARRVTALALLLCVPVVAYRAIAWRVIHDTPPLTRIPFVLPPADGSGFHPRPTGEMTQVTSRWGVLVHVPVEGRNCWNGPLPCSGMPKEHPYLRQYDNADLGAGFFLDAR